MSNLDVIVDRIDFSNQLEMIGKLGARCCDIDRTAQLVSVIPDGLGLTRPMFVFVANEEQMPRIKEMVLGGFRSVIGLDSVEECEDGHKAAVKGSVDVLFVPDTSNLESHFGENTKMIGASVFTTGEVADADVDRLKEIIMADSQAMFDEDGELRIPKELSDAIGKATVALNKDTEIQVDPVSGNPTGQVIINGKVTSVDEFITVVQRDNDLAEYMTQATEIAQHIEYMPDEAIENAPVYLILDSNDPYSIQEMILAGFQHIEGPEHISKEGNKLILRKRTTFVFQSHVDNLDDVAPAGTNIVGAIILPGYENLDATMETLRAKLRDQLKEKLN